MHNSITCTIISPKRYVPWFCPPYTQLLDETSTAKLRIHTSTSCLAVALGKSHISILVPAHPRGGAQIRTAKTAIKLCFIATKPESFSTVGTHVLTPQIIPKEQKQLQSNADWAWYQLGWLPTWCRSRSRAQTCVAARPPDLCKQ